MKQQSQVNPITVSSKKGHFNRIYQVIYCRELTCLNCHFHCFKHLDQHYDMNVTILSLLRMCAPNPPQPPGPHNINISIFPTSDS